jgi:predicted HTH transcriptional regulator
MIDEQQEENVFLDIKLKTNPASSNLLKDDKKNYAKALSGFSNTSGGVIIWGVDCRKNEEGVDGASEMVPIVQPKAFLGNLNSLISDAHTPINNGIRNILISMPNDSDKGFIVTYVPESSLPPHRAYYFNIFSSTKLPLVEQEKGLPLQPDFSTKAPG